MLEWNIYVAGEKRYAKMHQTSFDKKWKIKREQNLQIRNAYKN